MTEKDVIEYLKNRYLVVGSPLNPPREECERHNAVIDMAIKALEKRVPEQPTLEGDWLEELKRYRDLEEKGRLLVLPCKVGKYEKRLVDLEKAMDESTLYDWYVTSVRQTDTPVWTGEHIEELLNDFYVIPKEAALEKRRCEADGD